jgi:hypothetical protein
MNLTPEELRRRAVHYAILAETAESSKEVRLLQMMADAYEHEALRLENSVEDRRFLPRSRKNRSW